MQGLTGYLCRGRANLKGTSFHLNNSYLFAQSALRLSSSAASTNGSLTFSRNTGFQTQSVKLKALPSLQLIRYLSNNANNKRVLKKPTLKTLQNLPDLVPDSKIVKSTSKINIDEWITVFRFKNIKVARVIQRLKIYQTVFTCCIALPGSAGLYLYGVIPLDDVSFIATASVFACCMLYVMGNFCSRLVGFIYLSKTDPNLVRIAHLNFFGNREDRHIQRNDIVPFSDLPDNILDAYVNLKFYSDPDFLLNVSIRYGEVLDMEAFEHIFGTEFSHFKMQQTKLIKEKRIKSK